MGPPDFLGGPFIGLDWAAELCVKGTRLNPGPSDSELGREPPGHGLPLGGLTFLKLDPLAGGMPDGWGGDGSCRNSLCRQHWAVQESWAWVAEGHSAAGACPEERNVDTAGGTWLTWLFSKTFLTPAQHLAGG